MENIVLELPLNKFLVLLELLAKELNTNLETIFQLIVSHFHYPYLDKFIDFLYSRYGSRINYEFIIFFISVIHTYIIRQAPTTREVYNEYKIMDIIDYNDSYYIKVKYYY